MRQPNVRCARAVDARVIRCAIHSVRVPRHRARWIRPDRVWSTRRGDTGNRDEQRLIVALSWYGNINQCLRCEFRPDFSSIGLQRLRLAGNLDGFRDASKLHVEIYPRDVVDGDCDRTFGNRAKTILRRSDVVCAALNRRNVISAFVVRGGGTA